MTTHTHKYIYIYILLVNSYMQNEDNIYGDACMKNEDENYDNLLVEHVLCCVICSCIDK